MRDAELDPRLLSAASFVRQGASVADIGTDHAHLPIFLLKEGRARFAHLADVNRGPLDSAECNVRAAGLLHQVSFTLTDGAAALYASDATDYFICGMGGELIARIVADAPHLKNKDIHLILQPMSRQAHLRRSLFAMGFSEIGARYSLDHGRYYMTMLWEYTGTEVELDPTDAELGAIPTDIGDLPYAIGFLEGKLKSAERTLEGRRIAGGDVAEEERLVLALRARTAELKKFQKQEEL